MAPVRLLLMLQYMHELLNYTKKFWCVQKFIHEAGFVFMCLCACVNLHTHTRQCVDLFLFFFYVLIDFHLIAFHFPHVFLR